MCIMLAFIATVVPSNRLPVKPLIYVNKKKLEHNYVSDDEKDDIKVEPVNEKRMNNTVHALDLNGSAFEKSKLQHKAHVKLRRNRLRHSYGTQQVCVKSVEIEKEDGSSDDLDMNSL